MRTHKVSAKAKCNSFDIEIVANINTKGLVKDEQEKVKRKLRDSLTKVVSKLPFAHVYPSEVKTR